MASLYPAEQLHGDTLITFSDSGYSNDGRAMDWVRHFETFSSRRQQGLWRMLIFDGYDSHCTREFLTFCEEYRILPWCLPPHTSHLMQPLDVVLFQPFKHFHQQAVDAACITGCTDFNKVKFLAVIEEIRRRTFKISSVQSAFRKTGLYPYNPEEVLSVVRAEQQARRSPSPSRQSTPASPATEQAQPKKWSTPRSVRSLTRAADQIRAKANKRGQLAFPEMLSFVKGSLIQAHIGGQARRDLFHTQTAENARASRAKARRTLLQRGGALYVHEARSMVQSNTAEAENKA